MSSQDEPVIVIGSGMGGMAAAISLAAQGIAVEVHETASVPGGKLRAVEIAGQRLDAGPTVLTMRAVFDSLLAAGGQDLSPLLKPAGVLARHYWPDGSALDLHADPGKSVAAIGEFAGAVEARRFADFMRQARRSARLLQPAFVEQQRPTPLGIAMAALRRDPAALLQMNPFNTLWRDVERIFRDARLRQLFGRYATYCGSDPWQAPSTLAMIAQVEADGVWMLEGGLFHLARALESAARSLGVLFHYGSRVESLELDHQGITGVRLAGGERRATRQVVFNGDARAIATGLLGHEVRQRAGIAGAEMRSLSAITWNLLATAEGVALSHHNVFFSADYRREFQSLFGAHSVPDAPTVYVCAQDRLAEDGARSGAERLLCLVNAPALRADSRDNDAFPPGGLAECEATMRLQLDRCGLRLLDQTPGVVTTPADFAQLFPGSRGALYGMATHGWKAAFTRPKAQSRIPGLYLAGGSIHPGPGLPMAALSGLHAAGCALADRSSPGTWRRMATRGGTLTPWATIPPAD